MATDILIARLLGVEGYAEWTFFYAMATMLFYLTWFGINASAKVYVSKQDSQQATQTYIRAAIILRTAISSVSCLLLFILAGAAATKLGYPEKYPNLKFLLQCGSIIVFMNSYAEFYKEVSIGLQKYRNVFLVTLTEFGLNFVFGAIGAYTVGNVTGVSVGYVFSGTVVLALGLFLLRNELYTGKVFLQFKKTFKYIKEIFRYALPLAIISIAGMILIEMDTFMLGTLSTKNEVAMYSIPKQLCSKAYHVNYALATGIVTSFSVITRENIAEKKAKFVKISRINIAITLVVGLMLFMLGPFAIKLMYGNKYQYSGNILRWLVPYYILYGVSNYYSLFLDFQKKARIRSICYCSAMVLNLVFNWILIPQFGAVGASLATSLSLVPYTSFVIAASFHFFKTEEQKCIT